MATPKHPGGPEKGANIPYLTKVLIVGLPISNFRNFRMSLSIFTTYMDIDKGRSVHQQALNHQTVQEDQRRYREKATSCFV